MKLNHPNNPNLSANAYKMIEALSGNDSNHAKYAQGFVDAYLGRPYDDGIHPRHTHLVCIPLDGDGYRKGWLDGKLAVLVQRN